MQNSKLIASALGMAAERAGSNADLGRLVGIHGATIGKYRNGLIQEISDSHWDKLFPVIKQWLPDSAEYWPRSRLSTYDSPVRDGSLRVRDAPHPCDGKPDFFRRLCEVWDDVPEDHKTAVRLAAQAAIEKSGPAHGHRRKAHSA